MPEIAVLIQVTHVTGIVPATTYMQRGLFKIIEIALHDHVAPDQNLAVFTCGAFLSGLVMFNPYLNPVEWQSNTSLLVRALGIA